MKLMPPIPLSFISAAADGSADGCWCFLSFLLCGEQSNFIE